MVLLVTGLVCGLLAFAAAVILHFKFPGWQFFSGLSGMDGGKRANVDVPRLVRRLSVVFYILAAVLIAGSVLFSMKLVNEGLLIPVYYLFGLASFDAVWIFWRKYDRNPYPAPALRAGRFFFLTVNFLFFVLCFLFIR